MLCFRDLQAAAEHARGSPARVATLGYFDALHLGHQKLLAELKGWAGELRAEPALVTFDPHPQEVLSGKGPQRVLSLEHRLHLLEKAGVAVTLVLPFTRELSLWSSEDFVKRVFVGALGARHVLLGFDSAFGHQRQGTPAYLSSKAAQLGVAFRQAPAEYLDGKRVSTTLVREAIRQGNLACLERLLGRRFAVLGRVVRGEGRGRTLGFPTANIDVGGAALPPPGVYFVKVERRGSLGALGGAPQSAREEPPGPESAREGPPEPHRLGAVLNIGLRPTFEGQRGPLRRVSGGPLFGAPPGRDEISVALRSRGANPAGCRGLPGSLVRGRVGALRERRVPSLASRAPRAALSGRSG